MKDYKPKYHLDEFMDRPEGQQMKEPKKPENLKIEGFSTFIIGNELAYTLEQTGLDADQADELATWLNQYSLWKRWKDGQAK